MYLIFQDKASVARATIMARPASAVWQVVSLFVALQFSAVAYALRDRGCPTFGTNTSYGPPPLPLSYDGYMPAIDNETMWLHYNRHAGGAIANFNAVLARYPALQTMPLAAILEQLGLPRFVQKYKLLANDTTALRNNGGSMYNHAIFWRIMTTYNTSSPSVLSYDLATKVNETWGSPTAMLDALRSAAGSLFGSGWAWVIYRPDGTLGIASTPNQDNPIMRRLVSAASEGVPLIGVDVWEHAYYLKYRNVRSAYLLQWVNLVDWSYFQRNYDLAKRGKIDSIYC
ncbi:superoxide dismutase [Mn] [Volvox carteri f. nagariensis]|uniref:superoxide dismutase n=1 Tax=Volvox carteri f. nagariensis TaxID=3068 RepID=D8TJQ9_VOLCA|nr:superoxide dismutase [Mn] [Volvox carteri f. nagariensis]EFJ52586.1 superoxide dismutase [Mn] [Volvox carteri f. nagariensis]|eukprot:XP_002946659.1 superoxide dismutase [Mn] [Volvox carteri f. nagariensis]